MGAHKQFGETYRRQTRNETPQGVCEVCGGELEVDMETGDEHCPVCENPEE